MGVDTRPPNTATKRIFIGGLQRSGTTLLGRLLAQHPEITGLINTPTPEDEGQFVQDVYLDDHELGRRHGTLRGSSIRWAYHPSAHLTEIHAEDPPRLAARLDSSWAPYWAHPLRPYAIEKSPSNLVRTRFLQALFPGSYFIVISRHPVVQALAIRKWLDVRGKVGLGTDRAIKHWLLAMDTYRSDRQRLTHAMSVSYEDLTGEPSRVLNSIQAFLGVTPIELDISSIHDSSSPYVDYWSRISAGGRSAFVGIHPNTKTSDRLVGMAERAVSAANGRRQTERIRSAFGDRLSEYGYDVDDLSTFHAPSDPPTLD